MEPFALEAYGCSCKWLLFIENRAFYRYSLGQRFTATTHERNQNQSAQKPCRRFPHHLLFFRSCVGKKRDLRFTKVSNIFEFTQPTS